MNDYISLAVFIGVFVLYIDDFELRWIHHHQSVDMLLQSLAKHKSIADCFNSNGCVLSKCPGKALKSSRIEISFLYT